MVALRVGGYGRAALRHGAVAVLFLGLGLTAGAASGADNSAFVSYSGLPMKMIKGKSATVTVTMLNTGTTTWRTTLVRETTQGTLTTTRTSFDLRAVGHDWGVGNVDVTGSVAPNARRSFQFTITAPSTPGTYAFEWRMARDTVVIERPTIPASSDWGFGATTPRKMIVVEAAPKDTAPSFGARTIDFQDWLVGHAITPLDLPEASGGNGTLTYALTCYLPRGVSRAGKRISGAPRTVWGKTDCIWKASDSDANTAESDTAKLRFTIRARRAALAVSPTSLAIKEKESKDFKVKLDAKPTGTVTVSVTSEDSGAVGVDKARLTFTADNYRMPVKVQVTAKVDADAADETTSIGLKASGGGYDGVSASVGVAVTDDDTRAVLVSPAPPKVLEVAEGGVGKPFTVKLATQPTDTVTVSVTSGDIEAATVDLASLTFTTTDYGTTQTVKVTGEHDDDAKDESTTIDLDASGGDYDGFKASVDVKVKDDDKRRLVVSPEKLNILEGESENFTVKLATQPTDTVTVSVKSGDIEVATVDRASLTFTTTDYGTTQTVKVTGEHDDDAKDESTIIELDASGGDYGDIEASVEVEVTDDDKRRLVVSPEKLNILEGESENFTVKLATQPTDTVTVSVKSRDTEVAGSSRAILPSPQRTTAARSR